MQASKNFRSYLPSYLPSSLPYFAAFALAILCGSLAYAQTASKPAASEGPATYFATNAQPAIPFSMVAILSGNRLRSDVQNFGGGRITAILGGADIDLSQAAMNSDATITVYTLMGGVNMKIPANWSVVDQTTAIMGGVNYPNNSSSTPGRRLIVRGYILMG
ncbi:MAG: hypothetical protein JO269_07920, partial [Burkholderiaceae bacterium]|nr:hypothetical protein [Burkholderiaceae bacterium]